jgi:hypothetical protein
MKRTNLIIFRVAIFISAFVTLPLYGQNDSVKNKSELVRFEIDFAEYRISQEEAEVTSGDSVAVHLFGYMTLPESERKKFGERVETEKNRFAPNIYLSSDLSCFRLYTFLRKGEVEYEGKSYTADAKGIVKFASSVDVSKIKILGQKTVRGDIAGNSYTLSSFYQYSDRKIAVYCLGQKTAGDMN